MFTAMARRAWKVLLLLVSTVSAATKHYSKKSAHVQPLAATADEYFLSWRLAVEANNVRSWRTVPLRCRNHVERYMTGGQFERDLDLVMDHITDYLSDVAVSADGSDAWILDVDDTCISNLSYYKGRKYGCEPFESAGFKAWVMRGECTAIPPVLRLFNKLVEGGFKVFLVTGRDEETLGRVTLENLHNQGFIGYTRLIMRQTSNMGQNAKVYKSHIRKQLVTEGYKIWGNVGDQWSDLQEDCVGIRSFKIPNPLYFVP